MKNNKLPAKISLAITFALLFDLTVAQVPSYWPSQGWQAKLPENMGMDTSSLNMMHQTILNYMDYVDAFLIVKDGYLVFEKYYHSYYNENDYHIICSATKSITSILMGILLKQGYIESLDQNIIDFFPEYKNINNDPLLNELTIKHMLTFTTGLNHDDWGSWNTTDIIKTFLSHEFSSTPGTTFNYATPASQVLSAIINKTTGKNAKTFADSTLFKKLGITNLYWPNDGLGYTYGGFNAYLRPKDMLKLGYLYLNNGIWDGDTIISPEYVENSTKVQNNGGRPHHEKYGYNWWITENNGYHAYFAGGYGGQFIYVVPELKLVVAITCNVNEHRENARFLINDYVVPAIINKPAVYYKAKELNYGNEIVLFYPNPVKNDLYYSFQTSLPLDASIIITDISGKIIKSTFGNLQDGKICFNNIGPGIYFAFVQNYMVKKIVKE